MSELSSSEVGNISTLKTKYGTKDLVSETSATQEEKQQSSYDKRARIDAVKRIVRQKGISIQSGQGLTLTNIKLIFGNDWDKDIREIYGRKLSKGSTSETYWDEEKNVITKLFEQNLTKEQIAANSRQIQIYKNGVKQHPFLGFIEEVPGGWQQKYFSNNGNLREFLNAGGLVTDDMIVQAIEDERKLIEITGQAHGDLIKNPDSLNDFQKELLRKSLESVGQTGYINYENVLVGKPDSEGKRRLIFIDWAGGGDSFPINNTTDPNDPKFIEGEVTYLKKGLESIKQTSAIITET